MRILAIPGFATVSVLTRIKSRLMALEFDPRCASLVMGGADGAIYRWRFSEWSEDLTHEEREKLFKR